MPTVVAGLSLSLSPPDLLLRGRTAAAVPSLQFLPARLGVKPSRFSLLVASSSSSSSFSSSGGLDARGKSSGGFNKRSVLSNLIQDIEPLDVSIIQKDVPAETVDAMKRTISGMLGLLPSDQFNVVVEAFWDPLFKLLVSSMMTGYTLRNAEYRLSFERNLDYSEEESEDPKKDIGNKGDSDFENTQTTLSEEASKKVDSDFEKTNEERVDQDIGLEGLGEMSSEARDYIIKIQSRINAMKKSKPVPAIFVFGDSLADVGNNNHLNVPLSDKSNFPFNGIDFPGQVPTGRFSNGFNGIDFIAMNLGFNKSPPPYLSIKNANKMKKGVSFASAGSGILQTTGIGTLNMATQVEYFARTKQALVKQFGEKRVNDLLAKSLFYFVTANNDMFAYYSTTGAANGTQNAQFISYLVEEFIGHLTTIYKLGARKFAISGTGAVGCVPYLRNLNPTGGCIDALSLLSVQFNAVAMPRIQQLSNQLPGFKYSYLNSNNITAKIAPSPDAFGFKEVESACCGGGRFNGAAQCTKNATLCSNRDQHFFWDWFHPTQAAAKLIAHFQFYGSTDVVAPVNIKQLVECSK